jgi:hypothetical protein
MKKLIVLFLVGLVLLTASMPVGLVRLTTINKSGYDVALWLDGTLDQSPISYYLTVPKGTVDYPYTKVWTIVPNEYTVTQEYIGSGIPQYESIRDLTHNTRITMIVTSKSGEKICKDTYANDNKAKNECLDNLIAYKYLDDFMFKFNPMLWLKRLVY